MSPIALSQLFLVSGLKPWRNGNEHDIATAPDLAWALSIWRRGSTALQSQHLC